MRHSQYFNETDVINAFAGVCACVCMCIDMCVCVYDRLDIRLDITIVYLLCLILILLLVGFITAILRTPNHLQATIVYCIYVYVNYSLLYLLLY